MVLNSTSDFCRKIYTGHLLLDHFLNRSNHPVVPYVTEAFTVQARAASSHNLSEPRSPLNPTLHPENFAGLGKRGGEKRWLCAPCWTALSSA